MNRGVQDVVVTRNEHGRIVLIINVPEPITTISVKIPRSVSKKLDKLCRELNVTKSALIRSVLYKLSMIESLNNQIIIVLNPQTISKYSTIGPEDGVHGEHG